MKKLISIIIFSVALLTVSPIAVLAYPDELTDSIAEELADTSYGDFINEEEASGDVSIDIVSKTVDIIRDCFDGAVGNFGKVFATLAGIVALCALLGPLAAGNTPLRTVFDFVAVIVISMPLYSAALSAVETAQRSLSAFETFVTAYMPVMASLYAAGGNTAASVASAGGMTMLCTVIETLSSRVLMPLLRWCFAVSLAAALPSGLNFSSLWNLIRSTVTTLLSFLFVALNFTMSLQPLIAAGSDTFAMRTVRFASGNFVPVIGSMLGEAAKTVYASVGLIKSVSGSAAIVTVLAITVPPAITIVFCKFAVLLSGVLARLLGAENQAKLLYDINSLLGIMLGLVLGAGAVFIIATGVFIRINAGLSA